jgi:hypothetical protein
MKWLLTSLNAKFTNQMNQLIVLGYPQALGMTTDEFKDALQPLRNQLSRIVDIEIPEKNLPILLVITDEKMPLPDQLQVINQRNWEESIRSFDPKDLNTVVKLPPTNWYLLIDVEDGENTKIQFPDSGGLSVKTPHRSQLTIDEGVALLAQKPALVSFGRAILLGSSRFNDRNYKNEVAYITLYEGEFDYGLSLSHTLEQVPRHPRRCREKIWWGTPTCQFRISAVDADYKTEMLPLYRRDRIILEQIAMYAEGASLAPTLPTLETIVHATVNVFAELMSWHKQGYRIVCSAGDYSMGGIYLGGLSHQQPGTPPGDRPIQVTWSKHQQETLETMVRECDAQDYIMVIRYAIHVFLNILSDLHDGRFYSVIKQGEEPQKVDLLANLPR